VIAAAIDLPQIEQPTAPRRLADGTVWTVLVEVLLVFGQHGDGVCPSTSMAPTPGAAGRHELRRSQVSGWGAIAGIEDQAHQVVLDLINESRP
jgi:hypothetical protein